ncbi:hypothetical protein BJX65DRAFT_311775 [Aspergillus insuetus]
MLASEPPFFWLLKDAYPSHSESAEKRRDGMIDIFRKAVIFFKACKTWLNGQPLLRGIAELGDVYRDCVNEVRLHHYCWRPQTDLYKGRDILVVVQPGLAYVDNWPCFTSNPSAQTTEITTSEVILMYIPERGTKDKADADAKSAEEEDLDDLEEEDKLGDGDE